MIKLKRIFILFFICIMLTLSIHNQYQVAKADALAMPLVVKAGASVLGLSVGGTLGLIVGGIGLLYGSYYLITNWDEVTNTVGNALENATGEVATWWDGIKKSAVHKDDPIDTLDKKVATGEVIDYFSYKKNKEPDKKIDVTLPIMAYVKNVLDRNVDKIEQPNIDFNNYNYSYYLDTTTGFSFAKIYKDFDISKLNNLNTFNDENYIIEQYDSLENTFMYGFSKNDTNTFRPTLEFKYFNNGIDILFNFKPIENNNNRKFSEYAFFQMANVTYPTFGRLGNDRIDNLILRYPFTQEESNYYSINNKLSQQMKINILTLFKEKIRFTNFPITIVRNDLELVKPSQIGGNLYDLPMDVWLNNANPYPEIKVPTGGISIPETNDFLNSLDSIQLTNNQPSTVISDQLIQIKEILEEQGNPSFDIDVQIDTDGISRDINNLPDRMKENNKDLIQESFSPAAEDNFDKVQQMMDLVEGRMGILSYPFSVLIQFFTRLFTINTQDCILTFPRLEWQGQTLYPGTTLNLTQYVRMSHMSNIYNIYRLVTNGLVTMLFISLIQRKFEEMSKG